MNITAVNDQAVRVRGMVAECSDLLDSLESALDSAERVSPREDLEDYGRRLASTVQSR